MSVVLTLVYLSNTFPFVNQDQKSDISVYNVIWFSTDDALVNDFGRVISEDKKGKLWVGTDKGISSCANRKFTNPNVIL